MRKCLGTSGLMAWWWHKTALWLAASIAALPVCAQDEDIHTARDAAVAAYDIQHDLPGIEQAADEEAEPKDYTPPEREEDADADSLIAILKTLGQLVKWAVYIGLIVGAVALIIYAIRHGESLKGLFTQRRLDEKPQTPSITVANVAHDFLSEADALAAQGRYSEAVHCLLFRTLEELTTRARLHLPKSRTAREILHETDLGFGAKEPLTQIITLVEISHFGGVQLDAAAYHDSRSAYTRFVAGLSGATS